MALNKNKIIISVKIDKVDLTSLANYSPYGDHKCFEEYKMLMAKYSDLYINSDFISFLKSIFIKYENDSVFFFKEAHHYDFNTVYENEIFNDWIDKDDNKEYFIKALIKTNDKPLIRKHKTEEIYVVPVLNNDFNDKNASYIEALIKTLKQDGDDLWLLLHDRDLYEYNNPYHKAGIKEFLPEHVVNDCSELKTLIGNNKAFTFIHQDSDTFYSEVIKKLDELTLDDIIKEFEKHKRIDFAKEVAKNIRKDEMISVISNACETYDFSKQFLEL